MSGLGCQEGQPGWLPREVARGVRQILALLNPLSEEAEAEVSRRDPGALAFGCSWREVGGGLSRSGAPPTPHPGFCSRFMVAGESGAGQCQEKQGGGRGCTGRGGPEWLGLQGQSGFGEGIDRRPLPLWVVRPVSLWCVGTTFLRPLLMPGPRLAGSAACFQLLVGLCLPLLSLCEAVPLPSEQEPALDLGHPPPGSPPACSLLTSGLCAHTLRSSCCCPPLLHPHQPVSLGQPLVGEGIPPRGRPRTGPPPASLVHGWAESLGCGPPSTGHLGPRGSFQEPLSLPGWTLSLTPRPSQTGLAMRATCGARCLF